MNSVEATNIAKEFVGQIPDIYSNDSNVSWGNIREKCAADIDALVNKRINAVLDDMLIQCTTKDTLAIEMLEKQKKLINP